MKNTIVYIIILFAITSCYRERIDLELNDNENKKVVVTGFISTLDEYPAININYTVDYTGPLKTDPISGASVQLTDGQQTYELVENTPGKYISTTAWTPVIGAQYDLRILIDQQEYTSSHKLYPCPEIQNLQSQRIDEWEDEEDPDHIYEVLFDFQENSTTGDGYYGVSYTKGSPIGDTLFVGGFVNDDIGNGQYFENVGITDYDYLHALGDTAIVEIYSIGTKSVDYLIELATETFRGGPFDPPPANVSTNITGGAIGYFMIADARTSVLIISE